MFCHGFKVVSGGQTGVDRAALDWAISRNIPHGGWCPHGRHADDGRIPAIYRLQETPTHAPIQRTEWNVRDSDGTVIFSLGQWISGGTLATLEFARRQKKPALHVHYGDPAIQPAEQLLEFIRRQKIIVLNVAGPCAAKEPKARDLVMRTFDTALWHHGNGHTKL
jgi:hypothetical protein